MGYIKGKCECVRKDFELFQWGYHSLYYTVPSV